MSADPRLSLHVQTQPCQITEADIPLRLRRETPGDLKVGRGAEFRCQQTKNTVRYSC